MTLFEGKVAIVGGSSRGIGRAVAELLAALGASVVVNGRDERTACDTADAIVAAGGGAAVAVCGSTADEMVADHMIKTALDEFGGLDCVIACAGVAEPQGSSIMNITTDQWRDLVTSHADSAFQLCRAAAPVLVQQGGGSIVTTSSFAAYGMFGGTGYPAGKGAVTSLTLAVAAELREHNVRANVVCPGARTRLSTGESYEAYVRELNRRGLLDDVSLAAALDVAGPEYVASIYAFLVSDFAVKITGRVFAASGGFLGEYPKAEPQLVDWHDHHNHAPWTIEEIAARIEA